jgi:ornithine carbamoyltransferase
MNLKGRSFVKLVDLSNDEIQELIELSLQLKQQRKLNKISTELEGKRVLQLMQKEKPHLQLLVDTATQEMSMQGTRLMADKAQLSVDESTADSARLFSLMYDAITFEGSSQDVVESLVLFSGKPVISIGTNTFDPLQALADFITMYEQKTYLQGLKITILGDATTAQATSMFIGASMLGMDIAVAGPRSLWPSQELIADCKIMAKESGATMRFTEDVLEGAFEADVVYTNQPIQLNDSPAEWERKIKLLEPYVVTLDVMKQADDNALFLHPLPAVHDATSELAKKAIEVTGRKYPHAAKGEYSTTNEVFYSAYSHVFDSYENRLFALKALLLLTLK